MFDYPVTLTRDGDTRLVTFADVPEAITFGADEDEALLNAIDAPETGLSFYVDARKSLPAVSQPAAEQKTVRPSALECAKLGVHQAMTEQGIKKAELARRLGWHMPQVDRLFDLRHAIKTGSDRGCGYCAWSAHRGNGRLIKNQVTTNTGPSLALTENWCRLAEEPHE